MHFLLIKAEQQKLQSQINNPPENYNLKEAQEKLKMLKP
jgi:hypothetical protein